MNQPKEEKNTFRINDYEAEFVRFFVTAEETIYLFMELVRTRYFLLQVTIVRRNEILVDKEMVKAFIEFANDLDITFRKANGTFLRYADAILEDEYISYAFARRYHISDISKFNTK